MLAPIKKEKKVKKEGKKETKKRQKEIRRQQQEIENDETKWKEGMGLFARFPVELLVKIVDGLEDLACWTLRMTSAHFRMFINGSAIWGIT